MDTHIPLVSLRQTHRQNSGTICCLPGAGDGVTTFVSLVRSLTTELPVYGFQPRGLLAGQEPYPSIENMVKVYIETLLAKNNRGPFYLLGHSFGGYVAVSMALALQANGCEIASLILLDASAPKNPQVKKNRIDCLMGLIGAMEMASQKKFDLSAEFLATQDEEMQLQSLHTKMMVCGLIPAESTPETIRGVVRLYIANNHMEFAPTQKYNGPALYINALNARDTKPERYKNLERWRGIIPHLKYAESPGNHVTMLNSTNAQVLAMLIEKEWGMTVDLSGAQRFEGAIGR